MTDRYIDQDETQIYGPHSVGKLRSVVRGLIPELDSAVEFVAVHLEEATAGVGTAIHSARELDADQRGSVQGKAPVLESARGFLGRFSSHLDAQPQPDRRRYFTADGTVAGVTRTGPKVALAVQNIATQLGKAEPGVTEAATWKAEAEALAGALSGVLSHASSARTARRSVTPAVEVARAAWLVAYAAAKKMSLVVLELSGHADLQSEVFYDLQVAGSTKTTAIPAPAPAPS